MNHADRNLILEPLAMKGLVGLSVAMLWTVGVAYGQREDAVATPEELFQAAGEDAEDLDERLEALADLVKKHPRSKWADDAVWMMGELCKQAKRPREAIEYKTLLVKKYPHCRLQPHTKTLRVYKRSFVSALGRLLKNLGHVKFRKNQRPTYFRPEPIAMNHDLAVIYERLGDYAKSKRYYEACLRKMPKEGLLTDSLRKNYERVAENVRVRQSLQKQTREGIGQDR